jgi:hypothetical protein
MKANHFVRSRHCHHRRQTVKVSGESWRFTGTDRGLLRVRGLTFPNVRHRAHAFQWTNTLAGTRAPPPKSESSTSRIVRHSGTTVAFKTTLEVFTRVGAGNSLERLTERSVGLVTDRPGDVYELLITLLQ